jgi:hypothetical protein
MRDAISGNQMREAISGNQRHHLYRGRGHYLLLNGRCLGLHGDDSGLVHHDGRLLL